MLPPDRAQTFASAPMDDLLGVLLRQLKRPLAAHGLTLTDAEAETIARDRVSGKTDALPAGLLAALVGVVTESEAVLAKLGLTFQQSLDATMDALSGWESTSDFLELANEKSNAELRITLGAALAVALTGDPRYLPYLRHLSAGDYGDESVIARRVLAFAGM